jgi:hypothetical protein
MLAACKAAHELDKSETGKNKLKGIKNPKLPIHDGDGDKTNGGEYGPECKGHWVVNASSNDHSTSLGNIDNSDDKLTSAAVSLMKRIAQTASPAIRPIRLNEDEEWYVLFANSLAFRDLAANATMTQANRDALNRGRDNPLFTGGSLIWDGVIIREVPEIGVLSGVGASAINVQPAYLCGAQAIGVAWAQRTKSTTQVKDYEFVNGVGIQEMRGIEKLIFGTGAGDTDDLKDHGMVTGFFAGVADS